MVTLRGLGTSGESQCMSLGNKSNNAFLEHFEITIVLYTEKSPREWPGIWGPRNKRERCMDMGGSRQGVRHIEE